jgi:hypothetical protein
VVGWFMTIHFEQILNFRFNSRDHTSRSPVFAGDRAALFCFVVVTGFHESCTCGLTAGPVPNTETRHNVQTVGANNAIGKQQTRPTLVQRAAFEFRLLQSCSILVFFRIKTGTNNIITPL